MVELEVRILKNASGKAIHFLSSMPWCNVKLLVKHLIYAVNFLSKKFLYWISQVYWNAIHHVLSMILSYFYVEPKRSNLDTQTVVFVVFVSLVEMLVYTFVPFIISVFFIVNFDHISHLVLMFQLLNWK